MNQIAYQNKVGLKCAIHPKNNILFICLNPSSSQSLVCQTCILKEKSNENYASIDDIFNQDDSQPIQNWPKGISDQTLEFLSNNSNNNKNQQSKNKICQFYKDLLSQVIKSIEDSQQETLKQFEQIKGHENNLIRFYHELFRTNELRKIFSTNGLDIQILCQQFLKDFEKDRENRIKILDENIKKLQDNENMLTFNQSEQIKIIIKSLISKITFFQPSIQQQSQMNQINKRNLEFINANNIGDHIVNNIQKFDNIEQKIKINLQNIHKQYEQNKINLNDLIHSLQKQTDSLREQQSEALQNIMKKAEKDILIYQFQLQDEQQQLQYPEQNQTQKNKQQSVQLEEITKLVQQYRQLNSVEKQQLQSYNYKDQRISQNNYFKDLLYLLNQKQQENGIQMKINDLINDNKKFLTQQISVLKGEIQQKNNSIIENQNEIKLNSNIIMKKQNNQFNEQHKYKNCFFKNSLKFLRDISSSSGDINLNYFKNIDFNYLNIEFNQNSYETLINNQVLNPQSTYIIRFEFSRQFTDIKNQISIGLNKRDQSIGSQKILEYFISNQNLHQFLQSFNQQQQYENEQPNSINHQFPQPNFSKNNNKTPIQQQQFINQNSNNKSGLEIFFKQQKLQLQNKLFDQPNNNPSMNQNQNYQNQIENRSSGCQDFLNNLEIRICLSQNKFQYSFNLDYKNFQEIPIENNNEDNYSLAIKIQSRQKKTSNMGFLKKAEFIKITHFKEFSYFVPFE